MSPRAKALRGARTVALCALMCAVLEVSKQALNMIVNVELVSFFTLLFGCYLGWRAIPATIAFVWIETTIWGFGLWTISYFYLWPLLACLGMLFRGGRPLLYAIISGFFGLTFGAMCALPYLFLQGPSFAFSWWISGIPYDIIHGVANFTIALVLWKPMSAAMEYLASRGMLK
mgnify:CR=1 FL=1